MLKKLLHRPISVTMILLVFVVLGVIGFLKMPVSLIPDVDIPQITVLITDGSKSARELDESIITPLRQSLLQVSGLKDIRSESQDGTATITISFEEGEDLDYSFIEVNEKVDKAMSSLPRMKHPKVFKASVTDIPAFFINITLKDNYGLDVAESPDSSLFPVSEEFRRMGDFVVDVIAKRLEQLPEVSLVDISGNLDSEILIIPDTDALSQLGLSIADFEKYISSANVTLSNLTIRDGEYHYNVKFESFVKGREDIESVWFRVGNRAMQIKDVAKVIEHPSSRTGLDISNGKDAIILAIIKQGETKMSDLKKAVASQIELFKADYPQIEFTITRDQTELLDYSIRNLLLSIIIAILLDSVVIFLFLKDLRTPVLVAATIPLSLVISFFILYVIGVSINIISLSGLLIGVGMIVDNTIILTDSITTRWQTGDSLLDAITKGTKEVMGPMLSSTLTTCAVFIPLVFLNGLAGALFFDQAITITVVLSSSYLVSITIIPVYYWALYKKETSFLPNRFLSRIKFEWAIALYNRIVSKFLKRRWIVAALLSICSILIVICFLWMPREKLPPLSYTDSILKIDWNEPLTLEENRIRVTQLESLIKGISKQTTSMVGIQQFVLRHSYNQAMSQAQIYYKCSDAQALQKAEHILCSQISSEWPAAIMESSTAGNIFDIVFSEKEPRLLARLRPTSNNYMTVNNLQCTLSSIRDTLPDISIGSIPLKTDLMYIFDPEMMAVYDVSIDDLISALEYSLNGNVVFEIIQGDRSLPVVLGTNVCEMDDILAETFVKTKDGNGTDIPVSAMMRQCWEQDFRILVSGEEGNYYPLSLDVNSREVKTVMNKVKAAVKKAGCYDVNFSGSIFSNQKLIHEMIIILIIAVVLLFLILASQFESLIQPFIILSEIIVDIAFSLSALWLLGESINMMTLIGLVVVCGIVINDSILKIDAINRLVRNGVEIETAIHEAGQRRLKAIIMTSVTTILAVAPFLARGSMGDDLQFPMALVIIVGMTVGTFVSLFIIPTIYAAIYSRR